MVENNIKVYLKILEYKIVNRISLPSFEQDNEITGWIKCSKFLKQWSKRHLLEESILAVSQLM
jgi:hypothetical protein